MKQRSSKSLQTTYLCYSNAKSTLKVPLNFNKVEKTKLEIFNFVHLSINYRENFVASGHKWIATAHNV